MLTGVHFLLTYNCNYECDHCFLFCGPHAQGTFTLSGLGQVFEQMAKVETIRSVYFEGGEPFLYYPLLLAGLKMAASRGLDTGIVTNCYWALGREDAALWLDPLKDLGISDFSVSDDEFHSDDPEKSPARTAAAAARDLGLPVTSIAISPPGGQDEERGARGEPVTGCGALLRGRAAEKLVSGLPLFPAGSFSGCLDEELQDPGRVHIDPFGHVHVCQGITMGNVFETGLSELLARFDPKAHPILGPLIGGGPAGLARQYGLELDESYASACHLCYAARKRLLEKFPGFLAPRQVYGL